MQTSGTQSIADIAFEGLESVQRHVLLQRATTAQRIEALQQIASRALVRSMFAQSKRQTVHHRDVGEGFCALRDHIPVDVPRVSAVSLVSLTITCRDV